MPSWSEILDEIQIYQDQIGKLNSLRQSYIEQVSDITNRNVIAYYSGWLKSSSIPNIEINDQDVNAFMNAIHGLDKRKGLDLILHTPGGNVAATECIVNYLQSVFHTNIRAIVPQLSMSCGTMIAMSCNEIIMGRQSSLGPIDPHFNGLACQAIIDEFQQAISDVTNNQMSLGIWQNISSKYHPTLLGECKNAVAWSEALATEWLRQVNPNISMQDIKTTFISHANSYSHSRHISREECKRVGLNVTFLEDDSKLQDAVLSLHHCYMILFDKWRYSKIVENQIGGRFLQSYAD